MIIFGANMISNDRTLEIIDIMKKKGYDVRVRDIAYVLLCRHFREQAVAYKSIWGEASETDIKKYNNSKLVTALKKYIEDTFFNTSGLDISFEENKAYMLKLKKDTEEAIVNKELDKKDGLKILADLTIQLNNKFSIKEDKKDTVVIVNQKYNAVCPYCSHEVSARPMSKEEAMQKYNLIEKTDTNEL